MNKPLLAVAVIMAIILLGRAYAFGQPLPDISQYQTFVGLPSNTRLTIVSPHLDDETLGVGGLIAQARSEHIPVSVIFMTNGDDNPIGADLQFGTGYPTPDQLVQSGVARQSEAVLALSKLGVAESDIYFLGLPDRSLTTLLLPKYTAEPFTAPGTLKSASPYVMSYVPKLPYTGNDTRAALTKALKETDPTLVLTTLPEDAHKDHQATATFVQQVLPPQASLDYFLIHYRGFPSPRGIGADKPLLPPSGLKGDPWEVVLLSAQEVQKKQDAVNAYSSQLRIPELGGLMRAMVRKNELLLPASR